MLSCPDAGEECCWCSVWLPAAASSQARLAVQSPQLTDVVAGWGSRTWWEDSQLSTEQRKDREAVITVLSPRAAPSCPWAGPVQSCSSTPETTDLSLAWPGLGWPGVAACLDISWPGSLSHCTSHCSSWEKCRNLNSSQSVSQSVSPATTHKVWRWQLEASASLSPQSVEIATHIIIFPDSPAR